MHVREVVKFLEEHPLFWSLVLSLITAIILRALGAKKRSLSIISRPLHLIAFGIATVIIAATLILSTVYARNWFLLDHGEATIVSLTWTLATGRPLYHALMAPERYSLLYGPALYLFYAAPLKFVAATVPVAKITAAALVFLSFFISWTGLSSFGRRVALIAWVHLLLAWSFFGDLLIWIRADAILVFLISLTLWAAVSAPSWLAVIVFGIGLGAAMNVKIHAILYFPPLVFIFLKRLGWKHAAAACIFGGAVALLPFVVLPNVSLANYLVWLKEATHHSLLIHTFWLNIEYLCFASLPLFAILIWPTEASATSNRRWLLAERWNLLAFIASAIGICILGSKGGAGPWHLIPLVPTISYFLVTLLKEWNAEMSSPTLPITPTSLMIGFAVYALLMMATKDFRAMERMEEYPSAQTVAEIRSVLDANPNAAIGMGTAGNGTYQATWFRTVVILAGEPYLLDPDTLMDMNFSHAPLPPATVAAVGGGVYDLWLIPKGETPFSMTSYFENSPPVFAQPIQDAFFANYVRDESRSDLKIFDVWKRRMSQPVINP